MLVALTMAERQPLASRELFAGVGMKRSSTMRGVYVDRGDRQNVRARFAFEGANRWSWMLSEDPAAGFVSDGRTHAVIDEGTAAIVSTKGRVATTHRLGALLKPRLFDVQGWELSEPLASVALGRPAWVVSATPASTVEGKETMEIAFDQQSGIILFMRGEGRFLGFEEVALDEPIPEEVFTWTGPVEERRIGTCYVSPDKGDPTCLVSWQVSVGGRPAYVRDERFRSKAEAMKWAEEHALEIISRNG